MKMWARLLFVAVVVVIIAFDAAWAHFAFPRGDLELFTMGSLIFWAGFIAYILLLTSPPRTLFFTACALLVGCPMMVVAGLLADSCDQGVNGPFAALIILAALLPAVLLYNVGLLVSAFLLVSALIVGARLMYLRLQFTVPIWVPIAAAVALPAIYVLVQKYAYLIGTHHVSGWCVF